MKAIVHCFFGFNYFSVPQPQTSFTIQTYEFFSLIFYFSALLAHTLLFNSHQSYLLCCDQQYSPSYFPALQFPYLLYLLNSLIIY